MELYWSLEIFSLPPSLSGHYQAGASVYNLPFGSLKHQLVVSGGFYVSDA
jgi:hypothetical protein